MKQILYSIFLFLFAVCGVHAQNVGSSAATNEDRYYLVTSIDQMHDGDKFIIVGKNTKVPTASKPYFLMPIKTIVTSTTYTSKLAAAKNEDGSFSPLDSMLILTYEKIETKNNVVYYGFKDGDNNYLYGKENSKINDDYQIYVSSIPNISCRLNITFSDKDNSAIISFYTYLDRKIGCYMAMGNKTTATFNYYQKSDTRDVWLYKRVPALSLNEQDSNINDFISFNSGESNVTLQRKFYNDSWNTWCVPFDITQEQMRAVFGTTTKIYEYTKVVDGAMTFTPLAGDLKAGVPYLVWPENEIENPVFQRVDMKNDAEQTVTIDGMSFCGTYAPHELKDDDTEMFLNAKNLLTLPTSSTSRKMRGLRAYFRKSSGVKEMKVAYSDETTGVAPVIFKEEQTGYAVDLEGRKFMLPLNKNQHGLYIVNGKKVIVR